MKAPVHFSEIRRSGVRFRGHCVCVRVLEKRGADDDTPRVGVVTARGFPGAVSRNRARRRVRGCIMEKAGLLERGHWYLVECRPAAIEENYQKLVMEVETLLSEARRGSRTG